MYEAGKLHAHLNHRHVRSDGALVGPDPGVGLNLRLTRFVKSYTCSLPWPDRMYYLQAQAYWIVDNIELWRLTGDDRYRELAVRCARVVSAKQDSEGFWEYPQSAWRGRVATVEGCFGALGLLEAYEVERDETFLSGAKRWFEYMIREVGFQQTGENGLAVNYFSNVGRGMVPNNSTLVLWLEAALGRATGDGRFTEHTKGLVSFLTGCQLDTGELPYVVASEQGGGRTHYLCFQYNAFQFLDLAEYYRITADERVTPLMCKLADFLSGGLTVEGHARHDCSSEWPRMHYFTAAVTAALSHASYLGMGHYSDAAARGHARMLALQRGDGSYGYSWGDYGFLCDRRSYPRNQAMILRHLLVCANGGRLRTGD